MNYGDLTVTSLEWWLVEFSQYGHCLVLLYSESMTNYPDGHQLPSISQRRTTGGATCCGSRNGISLHRVTSFWPCWLFQGRFVAWVRRWAMASTSAEYQSLAGRENWIPRRMRRTYTYCCRIYIYILYIYIIIYNYFICIIYTYKSLLWCTYMYIYTVHIICVHISLCISKSISHHVSQGWFRYAGLDSKYG